MKSEKNYLTNHFLQSGREKIPETAPAAGTILVVTKIWDVINDPMMGSIVDRTNTKWGRFRLYLLFVPIPLAVFSALCFVAPDWGMTAKIIYALVTYTITGMLFTAYDVPLWGMVPTITNNRDDSNKCISSARFFTSLGMFVAMTFAYPLIQFLGGGSTNENSKNDYPKFMIIIGIISVVFAWITFAVTKEKPLSNERPGNGNIFLSFLEVIKERTNSSYNHFAFGCVGDVLYRRIGGLYATGAGYRKIEIRPDLSCGLSWVETEFDSVYG